MTLATIRSLLKVLIDQPNTGIWSTANLNTLIFSEYRDICNEIIRRWPNYYITSSSIVTVASTSTTALPSSCTYLNKLVDSDGNTVNWVPSSQFDHTASNAEPEKFDVIGRNIWWNPTPDAIYTYTAYYSAMPTDLSADGDTPILPPNFHDILAYGAAIKSRIAKEDKINEYVMLYDRMKDNLLHQISISQTNNARRVLRVYDASEQ